jgi:hypothetical protein
MFPSLSIISIEPAPITYFYFLINLFLNKIPFHSQGLPSASSTLGGVYAKHAAVAADDSPGTVGVRYDQKSTQYAIVGAPSERTPTWETAQVPKFNVNEVLKLATPSFPIELLKIDCEGCEFWLLPRLWKIFSEKSLVRMVAGELHLSVLNATADHAPETVSEELSRRTFSKLKSRGCPTDLWQFSC